MIKFILTITVLSLLCSCSSGPISPKHIHSKLLFKFTPKTQYRDEIVYHTGDKFFSGDCDDYATAAWSQLLKYGYKPILLIGKEKHGRDLHVSTCTIMENGLKCLDSNNFNLTSFRKMKRQYTGVKLYHFSNDVLNIEYLSQVYR